MLRSILLSTIGTIHKQHPFKGEGRGPLNSIPSSQGQNQPLYERHVTKSGRNRVKSVVILMQMQNVKSNLPCFIVFVEVTTLLTKLKMHLIFPPFLRGRNMPSHFCSRWLILGWYFQLFCNITYLILQKQRLLRKLCYWPK